MKKLEGREKTTDLGELGEEVWHARPGLSGLAKGDGDEDSGEQVGDGVVEVRVLGKPASALQERHDGREGADEEEGHQHHSDGATLVLDHAHLGNRRLLV